MLSGQRTIDIVKGMSFTNTKKFGDIATWKDLHSSMKSITPVANLAPISIQLFKLMGEYSCIVTMSLPFLFYHCFGI